MSAYKVGLVVSSYFVGLLQQVDLAKFQDNCKVDGLFAHPSWFLVEFNLLEDLQEEQNINSKFRFNYWKNNV